MVKYLYNADLEAFRREDKKGKPLYINIIEANRIINLLELGHSVADINGKIALSNPKGTATTINSFIRNYKEDNIVIPENAPAPIHNFESLSDSSRISALEERVTDIENFINGFSNAISKKKEESKKDKVRKWLPF